MTTLGLGDIVFEQVPGRVFTVIVVVTGVVFMLVMLPLLLVQLPPWVQSQSAARVRRRLATDMFGHVVLTHLDPVSESLIERLQRYGRPYVLVVADVHEALRLQSSASS